LGGGLDYIKVGLLFRLRLRKGLIAAAALRQKAVSLHDDLGDGLKKGICAFAFFFLVNDFVWNGKV